ncbi:hypothetical protein AB0912_15470 [Streptomyces sp. NPDC007084]|uniref:hypothetical protein n=1 Tax=Streptomyces sp. NPDC007084 TaxID=3154313 RepID=UPI00345527EB
MSTNWGLYAGIFGAATGGIGAVTGVLGYLAARSGNKIANEGNAIAKEANRKSDEANALALDANTLSHRQDQRETEAHDVEWEGDWIGPGRYALTVSGTHTAYSVIARVTVDGESARKESATVTPGESLVFEFPEAARTYREELREHARQRDRPSLAIPVVQDGTRFYMHSIVERVQWKTPLGAVREHENPRRLTTLGDFG